MSTIAFLGLGHMGVAMASRLIAAGHDVILWNRTPGSALPARIAATPAEAAAGADIVITMLTDQDATRSVLFGPDGVAATIQPGSVVVEMSTVAPAAIAEFAAGLPAGVALVDAPVGGSVRRAEADRLTVLAGGDPEAVSQALGVLTEFGTVRRCGGSGAGAAAKLVANTALVAGMTLLGETVSLADALGVPRELSIGLLENGPLGALVKRAQDAGSHFTTALAAKDLALATSAIDARLPMADAALRQVTESSSTSADLRVLAGF